MFFKANILLVSYFSSLALAAVHEIAVGNNGLTFDPESVENVAQGDILIFTLYPTHDVVQGDFGSPCTPSDGGFYSGPFSDTDDGEKRFVVNVTDDGPHYWYCSVQRHCQQGMVGGANVPQNGNNIDAYKEAAADVEQAETPSQMTGGQLVEEDDLDQITSSAGSPSATGGATPSRSEAPTTTSMGDPTETDDAAETASSSAGADSIIASGGATGLLGFVIGVAGFFL